MKRKHWILLIILITSMLLLSGCGVPRDGVDVMTEAPDGMWQTFVVWPLAKSLTWIAGSFERIGIPYHWGFAIIAFTLVIKIATFPLTISQIRGMQAQKELQPKIQELQKKYGKDREKLSKAQMELYQEAGVNPLSGCLPLIIQMPILFGLYTALVALGQSLQNQGFFWIPDLGIPRYTEGMRWLGEFFNAGTEPPVGFEYLGHSGYYLLVAYLILPILLVISQFVMQKWMTPTAGGDGPQAGMTKQITLIMTFMFGFFTLQVPAGLTLYWVTSNFLQMGQQWAVTSDRFSFSKSGSVTKKLESSKSTSASNGSAPADMTVDATATSGNGSSASATETGGDAEDQSAKQTSKRSSKRRKSKKRR